MVPQMLEDAMLWTCLSDVQDFGWDQFTVIMYSPSDGGLRMMILFTQWKNLCGWSWSDLDEKCWMPNAVDILYCSMQVKEILLDSTPKSRSPYAGALMILGLLSRLVSPVEYFLWLVIVWLLCDCSYHINLCDLSRVWSDF